MLRRLSGSHDRTQAAFPAGEIRLAPLAANTDIFYPRKEAKPNFVFYMGRRHEPLHQALLKYCEARGLKYLYSDRFLFGEELGRATSSAQYFVVSAREVMDPKTKTSFSPLPLRYFEGLAAGTRLLGAIPASGEYERFCRPTPCVKCRSTVRIWLSASIEIDKIQTINAPLTPPRPWCANIIRGDGAGSKSTAISSMAARWIST